MSNFDFEGVEPIQASPETLLPAGNYICIIESADDDTAKTGKPVIQVRLAHGIGSIRDWVVISDAEFSLRKVAGLFAAAGVPIKNDYFEANGHAKQPILDKQLVGKRVGVIVRDEDDNRPDHRGEKQPKVQGYCDPARILNDGPLAVATPTNGGGSDVPISTAGLPTTPPTTVGTSPLPGADEIPF